MYYAHFGLKQPPFKITPNTEFFFSGGNRGAILEALIYAVSSGEGIIKVVGEVGSGKTMLCRMLESLLPQNIESVYLANPSVAPEDVLHAIAFELHVELPENADRLQVMHALQNYLLERHAQNRQVVIFIEEAQGMPLATLEEIRLLSNLETKHDKLLQIVLFGQPELDDNLNQPHIRQLRERITHSFYLGPLGEADIGEYLIFRLRTAGYFGPQLFTKRAIRKIAQASQGLVRRINILADKAMLAAFAENAYAVTPKHVRIAVRDSEFSNERIRGIFAYRPYWIALLTLLLGLGIGLGLPMFLKAQSETPIHAAVEQAPTKQITVAPPSPGAPLPGAETPQAPIEQRPAQAVQSEVMVLPAAQLNVDAQPQVRSQAPGAETDILEDRIAATQQWLQTQPASTFTIQLMGSDKPDQLRRQLKQLGEQIGLDRIYLYRGLVGGSPYFTVLYGSYATRDEAVRALQELPKPLRANRPHLRTVGRLSEEVKLLQ